VNVRHPITIVLSLCAGGCGPSVDATRTVLLDADREFARQSQLRRLDAWLDVVADSALLVRPNAALTRGKATVRESMGPAFADTSFSLNWEPVLAEVSRSGDLGYTVGLSQSRRLGPDGTPVIGTGKYVTIWRKEPDGAWKAVLDIGVTDRR
jgi:ketosteroid isomerase-like protein